MTSSDFKIISQKDYLKKYMGKKKKKKVKPSGIRKKNIKIVDDNIDVHHRNDYYDIESGDDAPVVAAIIDERPRAIRNMELYQRTDRWQPMGISSEDARKYKTQILSGENNPLQMRNQPSKHKQSHERSSPTHKNHLTEKQTRSDPSPLLKSKTCADSRQSFYRKTDRPKTSDNDRHSSRNSKNNPHSQTDQESNRLDQREGRRCEKRSHNFGTWQYNRYQDDKFFQNKVHFQNREETSSSPRRKNRYNDSPNRSDRTVRVISRELSVLRGSCLDKYLDVSSRRNNRDDDRTRFHSPVKKDRQMKKREYGDQFTPPKNRIYRRSRDLSSSPRRYSSDQVREHLSPKAKNKRVDISNCEKFSPHKYNSSMYRSPTRIDRQSTIVESPPRKLKRIEKFITQEFSSTRKRRSNKRKHSDGSSSGRSRQRDGGSLTRKNQQSQRSIRKDYSPRKIHDSHEYSKSRESSMRKQRDEMSIQRNRHSDISPQRSKQSKKFREEVSYSKSHRPSELWSGDRSTLRESHHSSKHTRSVTPEKRSKNQSKYMFDNRHPRDSSSPLHYRHLHKKDHDLLLSHKENRQKHSEENSSPKKDHHHSARHNEDYRLVNKQPLSMSHPLEKYRHNSYHEEISSSENDYRFSKPKEKIHRSVQEQSPPPPQRHQQEINYSGESSPRNHRFKKYEVNHRSMKKEFMSPPPEKNLHGCANYSEAQPNYSKSKMNDMQYKMTKPLARYADDEDLDKMLREQERLDDPMFEYFQKKKRKKEIKEGKVRKPAYQGSFPQNRFGILPGHKWDGVDRSNGFEKKWFTKQSDKKILEDEAYRWGTEDM